jgi:hypothetical protein
MQDDDLNHMVWKQARRFAVVMGIGIGIAVVLRLTGLVG